LDHRKTLNGKLLTVFLPFSHRPLAWQTCFQPHFLLLLASDDFKYHFTSQVSLGLYVHQSTDLLKESNDMSWLMLVTTRHVKLYVSDLVQIWQRAERFSPSLYERGYGGTIHTAIEFSWSKLAGGDRAKDYDT